MKMSDISAMIGLAALMGRQFTSSGFKPECESGKYRLRNKTAHGVARKAKNKAARASRKQNRQRA